MKTKSTEDPFLGAFKGKRCLVTGHTGFKGSWLSAWLRELGAEVFGIALEPPPAPSIFEACRLSERVNHRIGDVRDAEGVAQMVEEVGPSFVFHLAAQALVRRSYRDPLETMGTNVMGTVSLLEAVRTWENPCTVVMITSDKCYAESTERRDYVESDRLGGRDPYAASKAGAELMIGSYRASFFPPEEFEKHGVGLASVRAGNVIGGGDWNEDRLVPDIFRALYQEVPIQVRNPAAVRPWQHVLDALSGYLWLAARMSREGAQGLAEGWNFGPAPGGRSPVEEVVEQILRVWGTGEWVDAREPGAPHEAPFLGLSIEKAGAGLDWQPSYDLGEAIDATTAWYRRARSGEEMFEFTCEQVHQFEERARAKGSSWAAEAR